MLLPQGCQNSEENSWMIWPEASTQVKAELLEQEALQSSFGYINDYFPDEDLLQQLHPVDLDGDGDLDIIYNGFCGTESDCIRIFWNDQGNYITLLERFGDIKKVKRLANGNLKFEIELLPCCGDFEIRWFTLDLHLEGNSPKFTYTNFEIGVDETPEPDLHLDEPIAFTVKNSPYHLRVGPSIDTTSWHLLNGDHQGNIYLSYKAGAKGTAYGATKDSTGREWWLVKMLPTKEMVDYMENGASLEMPAPARWGYMSSRYLQLQ